MLVKAENQDLREWHSSLEIKDTSLCWSRLKTKIYVNGILLLRLRTVSFETFGKWFLTSGTNLLRSQAIRKIILCAWQNTQQAKVKNQPIWLYYAIQKCSEMPADFFSNHVMNLPMLSTYFFRNRCFRPTNKKLPTSKNWRPHVSWKMKSFGAGSGSRLCKPARC